MAERIGRLALAGCLLGAGCTAAPGSAVEAEPEQPTHRNRGWFHRADMGDDGKLWIGTTEGRALKWVDGDLRNHGAPAQGYETLAILEHAGEVWLAEQRAVHHWDGDRWRETKLYTRDFACPGDDVGPIYEKVVDLLILRQRVVAVTAFDCEAFACSLHCRETGVLALHHWNGDGWDWHDLGRAPGEVEGVASTGEELLLVGTDADIHRTDMSTWSTVPHQIEGLFAVASNASGVVAAVGEEAVQTEIGTLDAGLERKPPPADPRERAHDILVTEAGEVWLATARGLYRHDGARWRGPMASGHWLAGMSEAADGGIYAVGVNSDWENVIVHADAEGARRVYLDNVWWPFDSGDSGGD
jgi:hypothetical protein